MSNRVLINSEAEQAAAAVVRSYKSGMPLQAPGMVGRLLKPEELMNHELDLGVYESPVVLAVVASRDPESTMGLAATARMLPSARQQAINGKVLALIGEVSRHRQVRDSVGFVIRNDFAPPVIDKVRHLAQDHIEDTRIVARTTLLENLRSLVNGSMMAETFVEDLFRLSHRCDLSPEIFKRMIINLVTSTKVLPRVKLMLIDNLERFPPPLRMEIAMHISALPNNSENAYLKRELEHTLRRNPESLPALAMRDQGALKQPPLASSRWGRFLSRHEAAARTGGIGMFRRGVPGG